MTSLLLVGCGDIALRLAPALADRFTLTGLRRNPAELPDFILPLAADVTEASGLEAVLRHRRFDYAVITLTPGERTEARYRKVYVEGTANILKVLSPDTRVLFVSSTSVYGQDAGEHVTEDSPVGGAGFSGRLLTEAENVVAASGRPFTCVRCSGIYGSGREHLLQKIREGRVDARSAAHVSNRIHADDVAGVLDFLITRWEQGFLPASHYIASDTCPVQSGEVWLWLAEQMKVPAPTLSKDWSSQQLTGKRCDSGRLQREGFRWLYPDFRTGYTGILNGK